MEILPILTQQSDRPSSSDAAIFKTVPVLAVFDAPPVDRGGILRFPVRLLDGAGQFAINVRTEDGTALAGTNYVGVSGPRVFVDSGVVAVEVLDDGLLTALEFSLIIEAISDMFIVRGRATGLILGEVDTGVYQLNVYEEDVYV